MRLAAGAEIAGFRLESLLGEGGMGTVWSAVEISSGTRRALKFLKGAPTDAHRRRFLREARAAMGLEHPGIIRVHAIVSDDADLPVIVMDLLEGEPLSARLARQGRLPLGVFADVFAQVLSAVGTAHAAGIVHRDLKPENIFLASSAQDSVRVLDFGIAKLIRAESDSAQSAALTATGAMMGTPYYMSPEQIYGERDVDHRSDVWSLGVIVYECLSGVRPFQGDNFGQLIKAITLTDPTPLSERVPGLPDDVSAIVARMLSRRPEDRPTDLREVQAVFRHHTPRDVVDFLGATLPANVSSGEHVMPPSQETGGGTFADATTQRGRARGGAWVLAAGAIAIGAIFGVRALVAREPAVPSVPRSESAAVTIASAPPTTEAPSVSVTPQPSAVTAPSVSALPPAKELKLAKPTLPTAASSAPPPSPPPVSASAPPVASTKPPHTPGLAKDVPF